MSKYIDAEELKKIISKAPVWTGLDAISRINTMKGVDLVRCKECKFREANKSIYRGAWYCSNHGDTVDLDGYCSLGERESDA